MAFSRRIKSVFLTAVLYFGASGATVTVATKRTGRIVIEICWVSMLERMFVNDASEVRKCRVVLDNKRIGFILFLIKSLSPGNVRGQLYFTSIEWYVIGQMHDICENKI